MFIKKTLSILGLCLIMATSVMAEGNSTEGTTEARTEISNGEKAYIALQVQNVMSAHEYYHGAGMNLDEVEALWVSEDGEFAESATFASPSWVMQGLATIKALYGETNEENRWKALKALNEVRPDIEVIEENLGAGNEFPMHMATTAMIEVAGDGQTAKGIWYSPGYQLSVQIQPDGTLKPQGTIFYEKYGADFVLEDGVWKMWHCQMAYDFTPGMDQPWLDFNLEVARETGETEEGQEQMEGGAGSPPPGGGGGQAGEASASTGVSMGTPEYSYPSWSPTRPGIIYPPLPEPYYTFSETFTY